MSNGEADGGANDAVVEELKEIKALLQTIKTELENIKHYPQHYTEEIRDLIRDGVDQLKALVAQGLDQGAE